MKKKILISFFLISLLLVISVSIFYSHSKRESSFTLHNSEVTVQSDVSIDFVEIDRSTNILTIDKKDIEDDQKKIKKINFNINNDGKIVLSVEIDNTHYEGIVIPYVTNGMLISKVDLHIINKNEGYFIVGEYDTMEESSQKINTKLEKVDFNEKDL